jgi:hemerythrin-like metal-binding protein
MGELMGMYVWKDSFNTGIEDIDQQHRMFLDLLNECSEYAYSSNSAGIVPGFVARLKAYSVMHFVFEEKLIRASGYTGLESHEAQHVYFMNQIAELEEAIRRGVTEKAANLAGFMRDWLINHILEEDKKYLPYLAAENLVTK